MQYLKSWLPCVRVSLVGLRYLSFFTWIILRVILYMVHSRAHGVRSQWILLQISNHCLNTGGIPVVILQNQAAAPLIFSSFSISHWGQGSHSTYPKTKHNVPGQSSNSDSLIRSRAPNHEATACPIFILLLLYWQKLWLYLSTGLQMTYVPEIRRLYWTSNYWQRLLAPRNLMTARPLVPLGALSLAFSSFFPLGAFENIRHLSKFPLRKRTMAV